MRVSSVPPEIRSALSVRDKDEDVEDDEWGDASKEREEDVLARDPFSSAACTISIAVELAATATKFDLATSISGPLAFEDDDGVSECRAMVDMT